MQNTVTGEIDQGHNHRPLKVTIENGTAKERPERQGFPLGDWSPEYRALIWVAMELRGMTQGRVFVEFSPGGSFPTIADEYRESTRKEKDGEVTYRELTADIIGQRNNRSYHASGKIIRKATKKGQKDLRAREIKSFRHKILWAIKEWDKKLGEFNATV